MLYIVYYKFSKNKRITSAPPIKVPSALPKFANTTMSKIRVTLLSQNPLTLCTSDDKLSKSLTCGRLTYACTIPANQPAASKGFKDVIGAATKAVKTANGCPNAIIVPIADNEPFHNTQLMVCCQPAVGLDMNVYATSAMIKSGIDQAIIFGILDFLGT